MKLTIELVPTTCWYTNVRSNVSQKTWIRLQAETFRKSNGVCDICSRMGSRHPLECHEIWGYDDEKCIQRLSKLVALCPACHQVKHIGLAIHQGRLQQALKWFCEVNNMQPHDAVHYITNVLKINEIRSQFQWHLDLSLLKKHNVILGHNNKELHFN